MKKWILLSLIGITFYMSDGRIKQYDDTYQLSKTDVRQEAHYTSTPVIKGRAGSKFRQWGSTDIWTVDKPIFYYLVSKDGILEDIYPDFVVESVS